MSYKSWLSNYKDSVIRSMPWIEDYLKDAFLAGQKYEKQLAKRRKVRT